MTAAASLPEADEQRAGLPRLLVVGGSDCSGGAGIQADIKTGALLGAEVSAVITAITAQNSLGVSGVWPVPVGMLQAQLQSVCVDIPPHAVKLGMLWGASHVEAIAEAIVRYELGHVVCDPVLVSSSGTMLLDEAGKEALQALMPRIFLLTPNAMEAAALSGRSTGNWNELVDAGKALLDCGLNAVLLKGGHMGGAEATDVLLAQEASEPVFFRAPRIDTRNDHGTGCVLASAIAAELAKGNKLAASIATAKAFLQQALQQAAAMWNGNGRGGMKLSSND
jgi:hydroxymethylpyrimidine/phosphomethylpyrimidine kinase